MPHSLKRTKGFLCLLTALLITFTVGCVPISETDETVSSTFKTRSEAIPTNAIKMTSLTDTLPPQLHSDEYKEPIPLGSLINTAGGEDSAFITPDGNTLYFFFTPDVNIPAEKQLLDGATGIYVSQKENGQWMPAKRLVLHGRDELALDGCAFVQESQMWFCSACKGNYRGVDIWTAIFRDGSWTDWQNAGKKLNADYEVGELHISSGGNEMYFHSSRVGGKGNYDIWITRKVNGEWQEPVNLQEVNTPETEGWPFITQDGNSLWFTRIYMGSPAIFRSRKINGQWSQPELIISQFAGEPSLDNAGNIYFTHHFYKDNKMIEADIYVAYRK